MRFFTGFFKPKNPIPGTDVAGDIVAVGCHVTGLNVGDRVFCFDDNGLGSQATYVSVSINNAIKCIPEAFSYTEAAASLEGAHYAFNFINKVGVGKGMKVLVNGASGAIGTAAVQMLKYYGVDVTAVCATKNIGLLESLGANKVIDYTKDDFTKSKDKFDFIFDTVGKSSFSKCKSLLKEKGIYMSSELGSFVQNPLLALTTPLFGGKKVIFPVPKSRHESLQFVIKLIEEGKFIAVIDRSYALQDIAQAYAYVESGQKTGNVLLKLID
jgi:NADPH:quinone reductase-like Zn-dependent oxidoreductase